MERESQPTSADGLLLTHFLTVPDVARSARFNAEVFGGWMIMHSGGGPTPERVQMRGEPGPVEVVGHHPRARRE